MGRVQVKICGYTQRSDLGLSTTPDFVGVVLAPSKRRISLVEARLFRRGIPRSVKLVAVTVNASRVEMVEIQNSLRPDVLQLHGDETPEECHNLQREGWQVWKAVNPATISSDAIAEYAAVPGLKFVADATSPSSRGGGGKRCDWDAVQRLPDVSERVVLAGGLHEGNVRQAIEQVQPWAVDIASGSEATPGVKCHRKIRTILKEVSHARVPC